MTVKEIPSIYSYWEIRPDGKAVQDDKVVGTWNAVGDILVIVYSNVQFGHTALSWDGPGVLVGENRWRDGGEFSWRMVRVVV